VRDKILYFCVAVMCTYEAEESGIRKLLEEVSDEERNDEFGL
jgi:hypothetical protein